MRGNYKKIQREIKRYIAILLVITMIPCDGISISATQMPSEGVNNEKIVSDNFPAVIEEEYVLQQDWTLTQDEYIYSMKIETGTLDLNGHTLTVLGDVLQNGGNVLVNGGELHVYGDYCIQGIADLTTGKAVASKGSLTMTKEADVVTVSGNFIMDSSINHNGKLTAGTLKVYRDFTQLATKNGNDFLATGKHTVVLCGEESQTLSFASSGYSYIANLILEEKEGTENYVFVGNPLVFGIVMDHALNTEKEGYLGIGQNTTFENGTYQGDICVCQKKTVEQPLTISGNVMTQHVEIVLQADVQVTGDFSANARVQINHATLSVCGDFVMNYYHQSGGLYMDQEEEQLIVGGDFVCDTSGNAEADLTGGTIQVEGDFVAQRGFRASGGNRVVLCGKEKQMIDMSPQMKFAMLELKNMSEEGVYVQSRFQNEYLLKNECKLTYLNDTGSEGWTLFEDTVIENDFVLLYGQMNLNGHTLTIEGDMIHKSGVLDVAGGTLCINGSYRMETEDEEYSVGILNMTNPNDHIIIQEDFVSRTEVVHTGKLTNGRLEVKGDFYVYQTSNNSNFDTSDQHMVILSGEKEQTISFSKSAINENAITNLTINNTTEQGVTFTNTVPVRGKVKGGENCPVTGKLGIGKNVEFISEDTIPARYRGDVVLLQPYTLEKPLIIDGNLDSPGNALTIKEELTITGHLTTSSSGKVCLEEAKLSVMKDLNLIHYYAYGETGGLVMHHEKDYIYVGGNFKHNQRNGKTLTAGTIEVKGNVALENGFDASGSHRLLLSGEGLQTISSSTSQRIAVLEITNKSEDGVLSKTALNTEEMITNGCKLQYEGVDGIFGYQLQDDTVIKGDMALLAGVMDLNGHTLTITGDLTQIGGVIEVGSGALHVGGNYYMQYRNAEGKTSKSNGNLVMEHENGYVKIEGNMVMDTIASMQQTLLAGDLIVCGNLISENQTSIHTDGTHRLFLSGKDSQTISLRAEAKFKNLVLNNTSTEGVCIECNFNVLNTLIDRSRNITGEGNITVSNASALPEGYYGGNLNMISTQTLEKDLEIAGKLKIQAPIDLNGHTLRGKDLEIYSTCIMNGGQILMSGNMLITNRARLVMKNNNDKIRLIGNLEWNVGSSEDDLTAGVWEVLGDIEHTTTGKLVIGSGHKFIFGKKTDENGKIYVQNIAFNNPEKIQLGTIVLEKLPATGYIFKTDIYAIAHQVLEDVKDDIPPTKITNVQATEIGEGKISISYNSAQDENGVAGYYIYRNGIKVGITEETYFTDTELLPCHTYTYEVCAYDYNCNVGEKSEAIEVTTKEDTQAPDKVTGLTIRNVTGSAVNLTWNKATDGGIVAGYDVYRDGELIAENVKETQYKDSTIKPMIIYRYAIVATDIAGNKSEQGEEIDAAGFMPEILSVSPQDNSVIGGENVKLEIRFKDFGNSTGNIVEVEWNRKGSDEIHKLTPFPLSQKSYGEDVLGVNLEWDISGITEDFELELCITVTDEDGNSSKKYVTYYTDKTAPLPPKEIEAADEGGNIRVTWSSSPSSDCAGYIVYRKNTQNQWEKVEQINDKNKLSYIDKNVNAGDTYAYCVSAYDAYKLTGEKSDEITCIAQKDTVAPYIKGISPENPLISGKQTFTINAEDNCCVSRVKIYIEKDGEQRTLARNKAVNARELEEKIDLDTTGYTDGSYTIYVCVVDSSGNISEEFKRYYNIDNTPIQKVEISDCIATDSSVQINWKDVEEQDFAYFSIEQKMENGFTKIAQVADKLSYVKTGLIPNSDYTFRIVAYDKAGNRGIESDEIMLHTEADTTAPYILSISPREASYKNKLSLNMTSRDNSSLGKAVFSWSTDNVNYTLLAEIEVENQTNYKKFSYDWDISNLSEGTVYVKFEVYDSAGNRNLPSENGEVIATYQIDYTEPSKVTDLKAVGEDGCIELSWKKQENADYYMIYRAQEDGLFRVQKTNCYSNQYTDVQVKSGKSYSYYVVAVDEAGNEGEPSVQVEAMCRPDKEAPKVTGISVSNDVLISKKTILSVLSLDNAEMDKIRMEYREKDSNGRFVSMEASEKDGRMCYAEFSLEDLVVKEGVKYEFRFAAIDIAGNISAYENRILSFDLTPPAKPELTVSSESFYVDIQWTENKESDFAYYEVYRRRYNTQSEELIFTTQTTQYEDREVEPDCLYYYRVEAVDNYGNFSSSKERYSYANSIDKENPNIVLQDRYDVICGSEIAFDGTLSYDNVRIEEYVWDFGDGSYGSGARVNHVYMEPGEYILKLTIYDTAGNSAQTTRCVNVYGEENIGDAIFIVKGDDGKRLSGAYISVKNVLSETASDLRTDSTGEAYFAGNTGMYIVSVYANGYLPEEILVDIVNRETIKEEIVLGAGSVILGELHCRRLELYEMLELGVDMNDPGNYHKFVFELDICFGKKTLPGRYKWIGIPTKKVRDGGSKGPGRDSTNDGETPDNPQSQPKIEVIDTGSEYVPFAKILTLNGDVSWLKEMYCADLYVANGASGDYTVEHAVAKLDLPKGLSLAATSQKQDLQQNLGSIIAGETKNVSWIIRGDERGSYKVSAEMSGTLAPFGLDMYSTVESEENIEVNAGEGLHIHISPEAAQYVTGHYFVYCTITNEGARPFYNLKLKLSEELVSYEYNDEGNDNEEEQGEGIIEGTENYVQMFGPTYGVFEQNMVGIVSKGTVIPIVSESTGMGNYISNKTSVYDPNEYAIESETQIKLENRNVNKIRKREYDSSTENPSLPDDDDNDSDSDSDSESAILKFYPIILSGDGEIETAALYPGQSIDVVYKCHMGFMGDPEKDYYVVQQIIKKILQGENLGVTLTYNTRPSYVDPRFGFLCNPYNDAVQEAAENEEYGDPVDMTSGGFTKEIHALSVTGADTLSLDLEYHSLMADRIGENGYGFTNSYEQYIKDKGATLILRNGSGREEKFIRTISANSVAEENIHCFLPVSDRMPGRHIEKTKDGYLLVGKDGSKMTFDSYGFLTGITGAEGRHITVSWDKNTQIIKEDISGEKLYLQYTKAGLLGKAWDDHGRVVRFVYENKGDLKQFVDANGNTLSFDYNEQHYMTKVTNAAGIVEVENTYDPYGRVITQTEPERGKPSVFEYASSSDGKRSVKVHDHLGNETIIVCDSKGNITSETNGKGETRTYTYNDVRCLTGVTDADGKTTTYTYDEDRNMLSMVDPEGYVITQTYDEDGNVATITSHSGQVSTYTYNAQGQPLTYINPITALQSMTYDNNGLMTSITQEGAGTTYYTYQGGRLIKTQDSRGGVTTLTYDAYGNVASSTDALGNKRTWEYDAVGNLLAETAPDGTKTCYIYNKLYQLTAIRKETMDSRKQEKTFTYDTAGRLVSETDSMERKTTYTYDAEDHLICTQYPDGSKEACAYDEAGNLATRIAPNGLLTRYTSDARGNVTKLEVGEKVWQYDLLWNGKIKKEVLPDGGILLYDYNSFYQLTALTDQLGNITRYEVDPLGNITKQIDPLGNITRYAYDKAGRQTKITDPNGNETTYTYDSAGNVICITDAMGENTYMEYDLLNRMLSLKKTVSGEENKNLFTYDCNGNVTSITDGLGQTSCYGYDASGNPTYIINPLGITESRTYYDAADRVATVEGAIGETTKYTYDIADRVTEILKSCGLDKIITTTFTYDIAGNHTGTTDAQGGKASATADLYGNITSLTDAMDNTVVYTYDAMDRCTQELNALGKSQKYVYDKKGQLIKLTDCAGVITTYEYDASGRLIKEKKGLLETTYKYDPAGNLLTVTDGNGTIHRSYDKLNRVTQVTDCNGKTIKYGYDELGNVISMTYPGGEIVRYRYDACQNLTSMTDTKGQITQYQYDATGKLKKTLRPDKSTEERTYDNAGRLTEIKDVSDGETIQHLCYTYDELGNIVGIEDETGSEGKVNTSGAKASTDMICTYGKDNCLLTWNGETVVYDANGNMTYGPVDGVMAQLSYDAYNRLVKVESADGKSTIYTYDAEDVRIRAEHTRSDGTTWEETFVTDRQATYSRLLSVESGGKKTTYTYGLGLSSVTEGEETSYYHYNHLGSTTAITDENGNVTDRVSYGTYGELLGVTDGVSGKHHSVDTMENQATLRFLYNGQYGVQTEESGLYYMRARYYSQDIRRFVNLDIVKGELTNTQSLNRYIFVQGNPIRATDPLGLNPEEGSPTIDKHSLLGLLGCIPIVGAAFSAYDAYLYYKEKNYAMMAGCIVGTVANLCGTGGIVTQGLAKSGIIQAKTANALMKAFTATAVGVETGYTGWLFGNNISKTIEEARKNGTISSATWREMIFTGAVCATTTALGVGTMKRASTAMMKQAAKSATPTTPTTTAATGTAAEVLEDAVSGIGTKVGAGFESGSQGLDDIENFYNDIFDQQRSGIPAYEDYLDTLTGNGNGVPDNAYTVANYIQRNGSTLPGYKGGRKYQNIPSNVAGQTLPQIGVYNEYDINKYIKGKDRGAERIVIGEDASVWYTNNHYLTFTKIK